MQLLTPILNTGILQIVLLLGFLVPCILFLLTQQNTLKLIQPRNRTINPGQVWRQLIPIYGWFYQFTVVGQISRSIQREFDSYFIDSDNILPEAPVTAAISGKRPLYSIGMTYCWLVVIATAMGYVLPAVFLLRGPVMLAGMICWVIYWVKLAGYKKRLERMQLG